MDEENIFGEVKRFVEKHWKIIAIAMVLFGALLSLVVYLRKKKRENNEG